jgi:hypothetical protein
MTVESNGIRSNMKYVTPKETTGNTTVATKHARKGTNKEAAIRLVYFLQALYDGDKTVTQLMQVLEDKELKDVSRRTVQRDIASLEGHFGVYRDDDHDDLWCLDKTNFDSLFELDDAVALALLVADKQLAHITPSHILDPLQSLVKRARSQLDNRDSAAANWSKRVRVAPASHHVKPPQIEERLYRRLIDGALNQAALKLNYYPHQGDEPQSLTVTALSIFYRGSVPYLICRDHHNDRIRQVPFSRISDVKETLSAEPRIQKFDLAEYEQSGALAFRFGEPFRLHLEIFNSVRREIEDAHLGDDQKITPIAGHDTVFDLEVTVPYTLNLIQWLMARSPYLKVKAPADFRKKFYQELARALQHDTAEHVEVPKERTF